MSFTLTTTILVKFYKIVLIVLVEEILNQCLIKNKHYVEW
jgi:hypothetical protein